MSLSNRRGNFVTLFRLLLGRTTRNAQELVLIRSQLPSNRQFLFIFAPLVVHLRTPGDCSLFIFPMAHNSSRSPKPSSSTRPRPKGVHSSSSKGSSQPLSRGTSSHSRHGSRTTSHTRKRKLLYLVPLLRSNRSIHFRQLQLRIGTQLLRHIIIPNLDLATIDHIHNPL